MRLRVDRNKVVQELVVELDEILNRNGFTKSAARKWIRRISWREDEVDIVIRGMECEEVLPSFRVAIPKYRPLADENSQYIAQINISRWLRPHEGPDFNMQVPAAGWAVRSFIKRVSAEVVAALPWFDEFTTPEKCSEHLQKYLKPGCPAYEDAQLFLNGVKEGTVQVNK